MTRATAIITLLLLLLSMTQLGTSRIISFTSDGAAKSFSTSRSTILRLNLTTTTVTCEPIYGFLPCTTELWGQLFLVVLYEYLLSLGNQYVANGSELFFNMIGPGIFGASLFHILGTIPVVVLMLVSGLEGTTTSAEEQAEMGMGFLAGSAVMLLTLVWGSCIAFGSTDFSRSTFSSSDNGTQKPFSFTGFGVSTDAETSHTARIMILSMVPFLILQLPKILNSSTGTRVVVLVSLLVTLVFLFAYCFYQVFRPWIQNRRFEYLVHKYIGDKLLRLFIRNGNPNISFMKDLFQEVDKNKNAYISPAELRVLFLGIHLEEEEVLGSNTTDLVEKVMEVFDTSGDDRIDLTEFVKGILRYISDAVQSSETDQDHNGFKYFRRHAKSGGSTEEKKSLVSRKKGGNSQSGRNKSWLNYLKASVYLILGTAITALLGRPLMVAVGDFATAANISSFAVSYVVIPLALNYRQALSTITTSRQKTKKAISLTLSEIYGAVFMNNMMGLTMFLALVYIRNLSWDVSAEVLVVLIICTAMGIFTSLCTKFPIWTSFVAFLLYPISLLLLYVLTTVFGWS